MDANYRRINIMSKKLTCCVPLSHSHFSLSISSLFPFTSLMILGKLAFVSVALKVVLAINAFTSWCKACGSWPSR